MLRRFYGKTNRVNLSLWDPYFFPGLQRRPMERMIFQLRATVVTLG